MTNIQVTQGTGTSIATETISAVEYQKVKLIDSTAASTTGTGIAANPLQVSIANSTGTLPVSIATNTPVGGTASGASLTANPLTVGGLAKTANPTAVTDGQVVNQLHDKLGKQVVVGALRELKDRQATTITSSTSETTVVTAISGVFADIYGCIIANTSATATTVSFKDATAGTTRFTIYVPAGDTRGFMLPADSAFIQTTANNNWTATCGTSVASIVITALYVKNI
jgi:hypothetical protein